MSRPLFGNRRAGFRRVVIFLAGILATASPAWADGHVFDAAGASGDLFGASASELEDLNNDGRWEFLVGIPGAVTGDGEVFLWYGGTGLFVADHLTWTGSADEQFGWSVARIGDVNNGGMGDFAVGAPLREISDRGRVYIFFGESLASGTVVSGPAADQADMIIEGENGGDRFGWSVSAAGDMDGDGRDDLIVGAPYNDGAATDAGAAYIIYGATGGPSASLATATRLLGAIAGDNFGWSVTDAGNFLAGTADCVAVGAPSNNQAGLDAGAVYVFEGRTGNINPDATADLVAIVGAAAKAGAQYGFAVRNAGRWNTDSYDDLAIGAPNCDQGASASGRVEIIFGATSPSTTGDRSVGGEAADDHLGWSLARARDYAGTSAEDLLIGAPGRNAGATDSGHAYVFRGGQGSFATAADLDDLPNAPLMAGTAADDRYGEAVASLGDFDGDGLWDLAVGAPGGNSLNNATSGFVHLLHSGSTPVPVEVQAWRASWVDADERGQVELSFALAEPAGNVARLELVRRALDAQGREASRATLWAAPPAWAAPRLGTLTCDGTGYAFTDPGPAAPPPGGSLAYDVTAITGDGRTLVLRDLAGPAGQAPAFGLAVAAFPNPSTAQVQLSFRARQGDPLQVNVFDVRGRLVRHLYDGSGSGAWMEASWDGRDEGGAPAAEGVYFLAAHSREGVRSRRLTLLR